MESKDPFASEKRWWEKVDKFNSECFACGKKSKCAIWKPDFGMCHVFGDYCKECYCGGALKWGGMLVGPAYKVDGEYKFLKDVDPKLLLPHKGMRWPRYSVKFKQVN